MALLEFAPKCTSACDRANPVFGAITLVDVKDGGAADHNPFAGSDSPSGRARLYRLDGGICPNFLPKRCYTKDGWLGPET